VITIDVSHGSYARRRERKDTVIDKEVMIYDGCNTDTADGDTGPVGCCKWNMTGRSMFVPDVALLASVVCRATA